MHDWPEINDTPSGIEDLLATDPDDRSPDPARRYPGTGRDPSIWTSVHGAYHSLRFRLAADARDLGLSASEVLVLLHVRRDPGCAAAVIRHGLGLHRSTLSSILDRLEADALVTRLTDPYDGRRLWVGVTRAGLGVAERADGLIQDIDRELRDWTSPADRRGAERMFAACIAVRRGEALVDI